MSRDGKFGTFGGVFTPSLLTILGVIMYLRLPWVVGSAGLYQALGIILVAHIISVSTGLSISSIATDKAVGAGGPYYIISRSLGLPIGGALGLALFVGLAFSISLYLIGFAESFLGYFGIEVSIHNIRICGTIALVALTVLTFISTALAIKAQYVILALIGLSLLSIVSGVGAPLDHKPHLFAPTSDPVPWAAIFAIFFPAVTGFTAGVNMSGDLRSPKRSIPRGTLLAIAAGFVVYVGLSILLAFRVPQSQLVGDSELLLNIAWSRELVVAGIWAATLSSALGSILGAPRILQAVSADAITPKFFAIGYGPTQEPRNALLLAFVLGWAGILIGELDAIARIVSMIFLTMYCVLNLSCAVESWASPDFRPEFRIPRAISVTGAVTCLIVMILLDLAAMAGALTLMAGLFGYLSRRQLQLESGDAWEGIWGNLVRAGLHRLTTGARQARNWKPNILSFSRAALGEHEERGDSELEQALVGSAGILTHVRVRSAAATRSHSLAPATDKRARPEHGAPPAAGIFHRELSASSDPDASILEFCGHYGFAGIEPNTAMLRWNEYATRPDVLASMLVELTHLDFNQLVVAKGGQATRERPRRIDIWWRDKGGNLPFSLSLARFITASPRWENASVRFVLLSDNASNSELLRARARRYLKGMRLEADVEVISNTLQVKRDEDWVRDESADADLVLWPLPDRATEQDTQFLIGADRALPDLREVLFVRASSSFEEVLSPGQAASRSLLPPSGQDDEAFRIPSIELPEPIALRELVQQLHDGYEQALAALDTSCVARVHSRNIELLRQLRHTLERHFAALEKALLGQNARRRRQALNRFLSTYVVDAQSIIDAHLREGVADQQAALEGRIDAFFDEESRLSQPADSRLRVEREREYVRAHRDDPPHLRRLKRRHRISAWLRRGKPRYNVRTGPLTRYYFERAKRDILEPTVTQLVTESHQLAVHLGKLLCSSRAGIATIVFEVSDGAVDQQALEALKARALEPFDDLIERAKSRTRHHRRELLARAHQTLGALAGDLDRLDVERVTRKQRKLPRNREALRRSLRELPKDFAAIQEQLYERAKVGLTLAAFHQRLSAIVQRQKEAVALQLRNGALRVCEEVAAGLEARLVALRSGQLETLGPLRPPAQEERLDPKQAVATLGNETEPALHDLPESKVLLSDAAIDSLEEGRTADLETIEVSVRSLGQFLVESELLAGVHEKVDRAPNLEGRALAVARDVTRLLAFQLAEFQELGLSESKERADHIGPVLESGLERVNAEGAALRELALSVGERFDARLTAVVDGSDPYRLTEATSSLGQHRRMRQGKMAVSGAQGLLRRAEDAMRGALTSLLYRTSAGVVLARSLRARERDSATSVERLRTLVRDNSPTPSVLQALPFYYRQIFFGQALNESFWVGRGGELAHAARAVQSHRQGERGILLVVGAAGSGRTALCQRIVSRSLEHRPAHWVMPPAAGSSDVDSFRRALAQAVGGNAEAERGEYDAIFAALPRHAALVIDDLERWWDRGDDGFAVVDEIFDLVARYGDEVLFIVGLNRHAFRLLDQFRPIADKALAVIDCGPLPARELGSVLTLRHGSTGMKFEVAGTGEDRLSTFQLARLFSRHFNYAGGSVGAALRSWVTHIDKVRDGVLSLRAPRRPASDPLDDLRGSFRALLLQLAVHRHLNLNRLKRITQLPDASLREDVDTLVRTGLVVRSHQGVLSINPFMQELLLAHFERQELLPT